VEEFISRLEKFCITGEQSLKPQITGIVIETEKCLLTNTKQSAPQVTSSVIVVSFSTPDFIVGSSWNASDRPSKSSCHTLKKSPSPWKATSQTCFWLKPFQFQTKIIRYRSRCDELLQTLCHEKRVFEK